MYSPDLDLAFQEDDPLNALMWRVRRANLDRRAVKLALAAIIHHIETHPGWLPGESETHDEIPY